MDSILKDFQVYCTNPNLDSGKATSYANAIKYLCDFLDITFIDNNTISKFKDLQPDINSKTSSFYNLFLSYLDKNGQSSYLIKGFVKASLTHFFSFWDKKINDEFDILEDEKINDKIAISSNLVLVEWEYIQKHISKKTKSNIPTKRDFETLAKIQQIVGTTGEEFVLNYEKEKLLSVGLKNLSENVKWVSKEDGDGLGYDIHSFDENGNDKYIEVKTTTNSIPRLQFFISANELKKYFQETNFFIYFVFDIKNQPKLHIVDKKQFKEDFITPVQYLVNVDVSIKE